MSRPASRGPMGAGPGAMAVGEKAKDFKGTLRRLFSYLSPFRLQLLFVLIFAAASTVFNIIGPKILGNRTGLSGFWVMFSIILFGGLWGIVGMVICVPLFAVIYDTIRRLVLRGLRKNGHMELWEAYRST